MMKYGGGGGHFDHHNHQQQQQHQQQQHLHQRQQQQQQQQRGVIAPTSSNNCTMFAMDAQSSVIKTAPPGRANTANNPVVSNSAMMMDFSPKQEPIDLAPLTNSHPCLQDLSKMPTQLEHYYVASAKGVPGGAAGYGAGAGPAYYEYLNVGSAAYPTPTQPGPSGAAVASAALLQPTAAAVVALQGTTSNHQQQQHTAHHQDWPYMSYAHAGLHQQQQQQLQAVQQQQLNGYLDVVMEQHQQQQQQQQQQQRLYCSGIGGGTGKAVDAVTAATLAVSAAAGGIGTAGVSGGLLSPVDSGIGTELSLLEHAKQLHEFFGPGASLASAAVLQLPPAQAQHVQQPSASSASLQSVIHHQQQQQQEQLVVVAGAVQQQQQHHRRADHHGGGGSSRSGGESSHHRESQHREQSLPVVIPKLDNPLGFQYALEAPISTSIRREDDRMTYVNKGQFYTVSLDYIPDLHRPLKGLTVRSQVMVVFREDKSFDEELRTWMLWHKRQHSHKQRIIEVDVKNCSGAIGGQYDEMAYNAVQFCWNPAEQPGPKVSIAVQCLSTDFSTQKGVKGLPLHVQIDTFDDQADSKQPFHRAYCQIKVFCDKGAERKLRDEDKRADKRRKTNSSSACPDQPSSNDNSGASGTGGGGGGAGGGGGRKKMEGDFHEAADRSHFYHSADLERPAALFVPGDDFFDTASIGSYDALSELEPQPKRPRTSERIMIYVRKQGEEIFTPLHLVPPTLGGLARAVSEKYNLDESKIEAFYKQCLKGLTVKIDDDMLRHYSNQDTFQIELKQSELDRHTFYSVTLIELLSVNNSIVHPHQQQQQHSSTPSTTSNSSSSSSSSTSSAAAAAAAAVEQQHLLNNNNSTNNNNVVIVGTPVQMQNGGAQLQNQRTPVW